jgi:hypothetical protein
MQILPSNRQSYLANHLLRCIASALVRILIGIFFRDSTARPSVEFDDSVVERTSLAVSRSLDSSLSEDDLHHLLVGSLTHVIELASSIEYTHNLGGGGDRCMVEHMGPGFFILQT